MINKARCSIKCAKEIIGKIAGVAIPIIVYGTCAYLDANNKQCKERTVIYEYPYIQVNSLYGCAVKAISNSDMSSYDKKVAITGLSNSESDTYYEGVITIANGDMSSYDKKVAILSLSRWR